MQGVKNMVHVRVSERNFKLNRRFARRNMAAKKRFLIKPDGTVWHRTPGLRHLKTKKTKRLLQIKRRMLKVTNPKDKIRIGKLLGHRFPRATMADYIMRRFHEARLRKEKGLGDFKIGYVVGGSG